MWVLLLTIVITIHSAAAKSNFTETNLFPSIQDIEFSENEVCADQIRLYHEHLENLTLWAHEMRDSEAKAVTGILRGSAYQLGNFPECVTVNGPYQTQYCLATLMANVPPPNPPRNPFSLYFSPFDKVLDRLYKIEDPAQENRHAIHLGLCLPASCSPQDIEHSLNDYLVNVKDFLTEYNVTYRAKVSEKSCQTEQNNFESLDISFCLICLIIVLLTLLSSLYDYIHTEDRKLEKPHQKSLSQKLCLAFSLKKNFFALTRADESNPALSILYGLRTFAILMIIMDHRFGTFSAGPISNFDYVERQFYSKFAAYIFHGDVFVDSFFVLSGLLASYGLLTQFDRKVINPLLIIFMRYIRLTPVYAFVILFYASIFNHLGSGPLWKFIIEPEVEDCRANWWTNILYINNYVNDNHMCMIQAWYLPCDFHYFIIAVIITTILNKRKKVGLALLVIFLIISVSIPFIITIAYLRPGTFLFYPTILRNPKINVDFRMSYVKSHTRAGPYVVGMLAGYIYYRLKDTSKHLSRVSSHILTIISFLILILNLTFGMVFYDRNHEYNAIESAAYASLHRVIWGVGTIGLLLSASYGHATILKNALSWSPWIPLSKLVYGAYLIHMSFQFRSLGTNNTANRFDYFELFNRALGDMVLSFIFGLLLYLGIEAPVRNIFKELLSKRPKNKLAPDPRTAEGNSVNNPHNDSRL